MNSRKYYTLVTLENGKWAPQFGSYDLDEVQYEREDYIASGSHKRRDLKIITTRPGQSFINEAVSALNAQTKE